MLMDKKGIALLIVISFVLMFLILGGAGLMVSTGHFSSSFRQIKRARAYYAAEAGMQHALWDFRTNGVTPGVGTHTLPADFEVNKIEDGDVTITVGNFGADVSGVHRIDVKVNY